jgi:Ni/Co efflux regulator RcnB
MKKIQIFIILILALYGAPQAMAQNKMSKAERKVMRESNNEDKEDQKSYAHKQAREHKHINRKERRAEKKEGRI